LLTISIKGKTQRRKQSSVLKLVQPSSLKPPQSIPMEAIQIPVKEALYIFRINFPLAKGINVKDDCIEYHLPFFGTNEGMRASAQNIIDTFSLPLVAKVISKTCMVLQIEPITKKD
jgi:hypothetical protein